MRMNNACKSFTAIRKNSLDKLNEECGVFGIFSVDGHDVANVTYHGLFALQHRGQESAGIAANNDGSIVCHKDMGLVPEVFKGDVLKRLDGKIAIGHVRYSTTGASLRENAQPLVVRYRSGHMAIGHNGNLVNAGELREKLEQEGAVFQSTVDSEVIANLISRRRLTVENIEEAIIGTMKDIKGSFALVVLTPHKLIGARDPHGIRPLCLGKLDNSFVIASESCALDAVGAAFMRDIKPGEVVVITRDGLSSYETGFGISTKLCIFEFIYFARPDSVIDGASVFQARLEAGKRLAIEHPAEADLVIGAPDSGLTAALGFSIQSGIQYGQGLLKNRYVGRTFIQPDQIQREQGVRLKFNAIRHALDGKRVVMVDDSIVRGTTTKRIVQMLKNGGAREVHLRISSPPIKHACYFGIDTPSRKQLVASSNSVEEIRNLTGADSLGYLSIEGLLGAPAGCACGFCTACFDGRYPIEPPQCFGIMKD